MTLGPNGKVKKDIEVKTSVFSSLPRLVDWKIYEPLFVDRKPPAVPEVPKSLSDEYVIKTPSATIEAV